jgi:hypothetical protein
VTRWLCRFRTESRHDQLRSLGAIPRTRESPQDFEKAKNVVFCAAPGAIEDYAGEVRRAVSIWGGGPGRLVFTSSAGVYAEENGGVVDENSPLDTAPRCASSVPPFFIRKMCASSLS